MFKTATTIIPYLQCHGKQFFIKGRLYAPTVSKPDTNCTGNEQLRTICGSNELEIIPLIFWHIVIGIARSQFSHDCF
jgi:hypothetical protein